MAPRAHLRYERNRRRPELFRAVPQPPLGVGDPPDWRPTGAPPAGASPVPNTVPIEAHRRPTSRPDRDLRSAWPPAQRHQNRCGHGLRPGSPVVSGQAPTRPSSGGLAGAGREAREADRLAETPRHHRRPSRTGQDQIRPARRNWMVCRRTRMAPSIREILRLRA